MHEQLFPVGYIFMYGGLGFRKLEDTGYSWWVCLNSTYPVGVEYINKETGDWETKYIAAKESEKPLYNAAGKLNRYGWQLPDEQVKQKYKL